MLAATGLVVMGPPGDVVVGAPKTVAALAAELPDEVITGVPEKLTGGALEPKGGPGVADVPKGDAVMPFSVAPKRRDGRSVGANGLKTEEVDWLAVLNTPATILLPYFRLAE